MQTISEEYMLPVIEQMLAQFPFDILGFHADNGSEYVNHRIAKMLDKLKVEFTRSRPRHSNDNGLAETKNGAVVRKEFGYVTGRSDPVAESPNEQMAREGPSALRHVIPALALEANPKHLWPFLEPAADQLLESNAYQLGALSVVEEARSLRHHQTARQGCDGSRL